MIFALPDVGFLTSTVMFVLTVEPPVLSEDDVSLPLSELSCIAVYGSNVMLIDAAA